MLLSPRAEYALRALAILATEPADRAVGAAELAERAHVPPAFLSKVMRRLVVGGLVLGQKGHGGGFRLALPPARIRIAAVLDAMAFMVAADHCAFGWQKCNNARPCPLHPLYGELKASFRAWSERSTLADVDPNGYLAPPTRGGQARSRGMGKARGGG